SETILGLVLMARRSEVVIATKGGFRNGTPRGHAGLSRRHILWSVEESRKRLRTDWIDVDVVHKEDPFTPLEETLSAL
ncbi:aldo/keto reductase, partial [Rhizobium ruizarguesonis]